jgi:hypothetical protein
VLLQGPYLPGGAAGPKGEKGLAEARMEAKVWLVQRGLASLADRIIATPAHNHVEIPAALLAQTGG